jgi:hypothetical protein
MVETSLWGRISKASESRAQMSENITTVVDKNNQWAVKSKHAALPWMFAFAWVDKS